MGKIIQIEVPDWIDVGDLRRDVQRIIALKAIEKIGSEVSDKEIDNLSEGIKETIWREMKEWLK